MIAARAGVSLTTVSFALRRNPRIPEATRARVVRAAEELGYMPDPEIAKLMHRLRTRRPRGFQSTLAALTTVPEGRDLPYIRGIMEQARTRAGELGYGLMVVRLEDGAGPRPDVERMLRSRGVEGLLLLPLAMPRDFSALLNWKHFSVVTTTHGVRGPEFHRVVPHQFGNTLTVCAELLRRGYRRIGIVIAAQHDVVVNHGFTAGVVWQNQVGGAEPVAPFVYHGDDFSGLRAWFAREWPDAIIAEGDDYCRRFAAELNLRIPGPVGFVSANKSGASIFAGVDERPAEIGSAAVRLLTSMLQHGEKGVPAVPTLTMVKGAWVDGRSVRAEPRAAAKKR